MQKRQLRLRLTLFFVLIATLLVACGDNTATTASQPSATTAPAAATTTAGSATTAAGAATTAAASTGGSNTLKVWFPGNTPAEMDEVTKKLVPAFEAANPGVKVNVEFVDWGNISTKLNTAFAGGTAPDVFGHGVAATAGFASNDRLLPLDPYLDKWDPKMIADFGTLLDQGKYNGKRYSVPIRGDARLIAYRTDLFTEVGLDPAKPPTNWQEFTAAAQKLTKKSGSRIDRSGFLFLTTADAGLQQVFLTFLTQAGGSQMNADLTKLTWNSPEGVKALQYMIDTYNGPNAVATGLGENYSSLAPNQNPLVTGRAAMEMVSPDVLGAIRAANPDIYSKIAVMPPLKEVKQTAFGGAGTVLFINKDTKNPDLAWKFIDFMNQDSTLEEYLPANGGFPMRTSLLNSELVTTKVPYFKPFVEDIPYYVGNPNIPTWTQVRDVLIRYLDKAMHGTLSAKDALDQATAEGQAIIDKK
jgi:multiple sugar transport system substrate-binding protein